MSDATPIQWTDATWNPIRGCARVSAGCENCYAERVAHRFSGPGKPFEGLTVSGSNGPRWTGKVRLVPELLDQPLRWRKPRRIFVNSMSDLFHEDVPDSFIRGVFSVMATTSELNGHRFQVLTKRPDRMRDLVSQMRWRFGLNCIFGKHLLTHLCVMDGDPDIGGHHLEWVGAPPGVWLGVSCEDQKAAAERIPILLQTPAAIRFASAEPLLGPIDFGQVRNTVRMAEGQDWIDALGGRCWTCTGPDYYDTTPADAALDWVIVGGESGPRARPCDVGWVRSIVEQCRAASVPCFVKQLGARSIFFPGDDVTGHDGIAQPLDLINRAGSDRSEWPEDLRVREFPR